MTQHRIVIIDGHIVCQWFELRKWWTMSKAFNNNADDFAIWTYSEANLARAKALVKEQGVSVVTVQQKPVQRGDRWFVQASDLTGERDYREALRQLARLV